MAARPAITLTVAARHDLLAIWEYLAKDNEAAADPVLDSLDARMQRLADPPLLDPARPDIAPDLRYLVSDNYLILYRLLPAAVEIVRVLHGARNLSAILTDADRRHWPRPPLHPRTMREVFKKGGRAEPPKNPAISSPALPRRRRSKRIVYERTSGPATRRTTIYARVSTFDKGQHPETPLWELRRFAEARGLAVAHELVDIASGSGIPARTTASSSSLRASG